MLAVEDGCSFDTLRGVGVEFVAKPFPFDDGDGNVTVLLFPLLVGTDAERAFSESGHVPLFAGGG